MTESGLGVYGTSYKTFFPTTRDSVNGEQVFLQTSYPNKKSIRIKTKTTETITQGIKLGTTQLKSHRNRYQSMQSEIQQSKSMSYQDQQYQGCKNIRCTKIMSQLLLSRDEDQQTIKYLTAEIDKLRKQAAEYNKHQIIDEEKYKERLVSATGRVQVQKTLGFFNQFMESSSIIQVQKTDSIFLNKSIGLHHKKENLNSFNVLSKSNETFKNDITKLQEIYNNSQLMNYCYFSHQDSEIQLPYIKCERCEQIRNEHIIKLECKHQFHQNCFIEDIINQFLKQQESFNPTGQLQCFCKKKISLQYIKQLPNPLFQIVYQILANQQLYILLKNYYFTINGVESKKTNLLKCIKEHCYFIIIQNEQKISYCPLCCEFNMFVQIKFI